MKRGVLILAIIYLFVLLVWAVVMHTSLNSYWLVTLFLFVPRLVVVLPLLTLVPLTLVARWRLTSIYFIHLVLIVGPIFGYQIPSSTPIAANEQLRLRVMTCNVAGGKVDKRQLIHLINDQSVDVLMLQECSQSSFQSFFSTLGWNRRHIHNIAIASSMDLGEVQELARQPKEYNDAIVGIGCVVQCPDGQDVPLVSVHLPTFRPALEPLLRFDIKQSAMATQQQGEFFRRVSLELRESIHVLGSSAIIAGDFNVPVESAYYQDLWGGLQNAFSVAGTGFGYTKHTRYHGVRIDHVLVDDGWQIVSAIVGPDLGGDHRPVIVELAKRVSP